MFGISNWQRASKGFGLLCPLPLQPQQRKHVKPSSNTEAFFGAASRLEQNNDKLISVDNVSIKDIAQAHEQSCVLITIIGFCVPPNTKS